MSDQNDDSWVYSGRGAAPALRWSFTADAPLVDMKLARESGEIILADNSGALYLLDRRGRVTSLTRTRHKIQRVAWSDNGTAGVASFNNFTLGWFDRKMQFQWSREMDDEIISVAITPHATHVFVGLASGINHVLTSENRPYSRFESIRPLKHIQFLTTTPEIIAAAEHGLLGRYQLNGSATWTQKLWNNVGDLAASGDGRYVYAAGFSHGAQVYDGESGETKGTFVAEGTIGLISCAFTKKHLVASTLERNVFSLNPEGNLVWHLTAPDDINRLLMSPLADWIACGFSSGRIVRLDNGR